MKGGVRQAKKIGRHFYMKELSKLLSSFNLRCGLSFVLICQVSPWLLYERVQ